MDYSGTEFTNLTREIEEQGGEHLDLLHDRRVIRVAKQTPKGEKGESSRVNSTHCNDAALFSIAFERAIFAGSPSTDQKVDLEERQSDGKLAAMAIPVDGEQDSIVVCVKDDCVGLWPRFIGSWEDED